MLRMCEWGGGGVLYTVGNNAMYVQFKGVKGLVTVVLGKFFKIIYESLFFIHFPINPAFQEPLVYMLRYKFREAADLQGGTNAPLPP